MAYTETAQYCDSAQYTAVTAWATGSKTVGQIVRQSAAPTVGNERCFICTVAGSAGGSEPTWVVTRGAKTTDSAVTWMECTGLPALNGDSTNTPVWAASKGAIALGALIKNVAATHYFICTTAGTGGTGSEPIWNTTAGVTTADASVTWTCLGAISSFSATWKAPHARMANLTGAWLLNNNMNAFVGDDHAETYTSNSANVNFTTNAGPPGNTSVLCVDHTAAVPPGSGNLKTTALLTMSGSNALTVAAGAGYTTYFYGIGFSVSTSNTPTFGAGATGTRNRFEQCLFSTTSGGAPISIGATNTQNEFQDCTFHFASTSTAILLERGRINFRNMALSGTLGGGTTPLFIAGSPSNTIASIEGSDLSTYASTPGLVGSAVPPSGIITFKDCALPSGLPIYYRGSAGDVQMTEGLTIDLIRCDSGSAAYRNERHNTNATQTTSTVVVRTGGAADGTTAISHQIVTTANATNAAKLFDAIPLAKWNSVTGSNRNVTVYGIVNDSRVPKNDEVWIDVEYLGSSSTPLGSYCRGGKSNVLASGSSLTADSTSAWDTAATVRANSHAYVLGDTVKVASNPGRIFFCTTAGTSAGSEPSGYATAVDGGSVTDSGAVFRAGCRFSQTLTLSSPQPQLAGYLYAYPRFGRASFTYFLDPLVYLS
jgi:hypothetical protein